MLISRVLYHSSIPASHRLFSDIYLHLIILFFNLILQNKIMRKVLLFLSVLVGSLSVSAQDFTSDPVGNVFTEGSPVQTIVTGVAHVQNNTNAPIEVRWVRENVNLPMGWTSSVCDLNLCWSSTTNTQTFIIEPTRGTGEILDVQFSPNGIEGLGRADVACYRASDNAPLLRLTYHCGVYLVGTTQVETVTAKAFPNPTTDFINITNNTNIASGYLKDVVGATVRSFSINGATAQWQVGDLPKGIYFLEMHSDNAKLLKTIKIVVQ
jgi:Secretion system C-terminal sorting domain